MQKNDRTAIAAVAAAGVLWGLTVPLSKLALAWLDPAWLTLARFALAAGGLGFAARTRLRDALDFKVIIAGAIGFGAVIMLQNAGVQRTSVSHAAVLVGMVPVFVALMAARDPAARPRNIDWGGYSVALVGIALVAGSGGDGATPLGDGLVLISAVLSALFIVVQPRLLRGRDAAAVTAVQFAAGAGVALPLAALHGAPAAPPAITPVLALGTLAIAGTLLPFWLFAHGQARVPVRTAGVFLNLEPVVGAAVGWMAFGNTAAVTQLAGVAAVLVGIALGNLPERTSGEGRRVEKLVPHPSRLTPYAVSITLATQDPAVRVVSERRHAAPRNALRRRPPRRLAACAATGRRPVAV
jgi:drug/metabolite transporter (DMT)-like permease